MLVGPESDQYALLAGQIADVRILRELAHPDEDYPYSTIQSLAQVVAGVGGLSAVKRIGLGGRGLMEADVWCRTSQSHPISDPKIEFLAGD
jgi:hypothetical protein